MWSVAATCKVNLIGGGEVGSFSLPSKYKVNIVRPVEASQQFQCKGNETVSMSIYWPVSEMHPSDITQQC